MHLTFSSLKSQKYDSFWRVSARILLRWVQISYPALSKYGYGHMLWISSTHNRISYLKKTKNKIKIPNR